MDYEKTRIVYKGSFARKLLRAGFRIIDIRPRKQRDGSINFNESIFVFEYAPGIDEIIKQLIEKK